MFWDGQLSIPCLLCDLLTSSHAYQLTMQWMHSWVSVGFRSRGALSENEARVFFQQLVVAIDYCHRVGIVNRWGCQAAIMMDMCSRQGGIVCAT